MSILETRGRRCFLRPSFLVFLELIHRPRAAVLLSSPSVIVTGIIILSAAGTVMFDFVAWLANRPASHWL